MFSSVWAKSVKSELDSDNDRNQGNHSVPVPVVALLLVLDNSVFPKRHLDLAIGHVQSQHGYVSSSS